MFQGGKFTTKLVNGVSERSLVNKVVNDSERITSNPLILNCILTTKLVNAVIVHSPPPLGGSER